MDNVLLKSIEMPLISLIIVFLALAVLSLVLLDLARSNSELASFINPIINKYNECIKYQDPGPQFHGIDNIGMIVGNISIEDTS